MWNTAEPNKCGILQNQIVGHSVSEWGSEVPTQTSALEGEGEGGPSGWG